MPLSDVLKPFQAYVPANSAGSKLRTLLDAIDEGVSMKLESVPSNGDALRNAFGALLGSFTPSRCGLPGLSTFKLDDVLQKAVGFLSTYLHIFI